MLGRGYLTQRKSNVLARLRSSHCLAQQLDSKPERRAQARARKKNAAKQTTNASVEKESGIESREAKRRVDERRLAAAAKISAAKSLARRLASEQETAFAAAQVTADHTLDEAEIKTLKRSVGASSATAAREAAVAGAKERSTRRHGDIFSSQLVELARMKEENEALQQLVLEVAANKKAARERIASLKQDYNDLLNELVKNPQLENGALKSSQSKPNDTTQAANAESSKVGGHKPVEEPIQTEGSKSSKEDHQHSSADLLEKAQKAALDGRTIFYKEGEGIPVKEGGTLFFNAASSKLSGNGGLQIKMGLNKWQEIIIEDMQKAEALASIDNSNWWSTDLNFDEDVFKVNFVIIDSRSHAVDNNKGEDYEVNLLDALSEEQIIERQALTMTEMEEKRVQVMERDEERQWNELRDAAYKEADEARDSARHRLEERTWSEAAATVSDLQSNLREHRFQSEWEGTLFWAQAPAAGQKAVILYNKASAGISNANGLLLHFGVNFWHKKHMTSVELSLVSADQKEALKIPDYGEWWTGSFETPKLAEVLDFVFSDASRKIWDNNRNKDYHVQIQDALSKEKLIQTIFDESWRAKQDELKEAQDNAAKRTIRRMEEKAKAARKRREKQRHIFFSEPVTPQAGTSCTLFYNPDITNLRGRPEIWLRGSFNRSTHPGKFGPLQMHPTLHGGSGPLKAEVKIPKDAWCMDFALSDSAEGRAFLDNNSGMEYHIDTSGSSVPQPALDVVHIAVEMAPIAKVGGMADVVTALGRAVKEAGHNVKIIIPKYDVINYAEVRGIQQRGDFWFGGTQVKVWQGIVEDLDTVFLEPCNGSVWAGCIYGRNDDAARFGFFCGAASEFLKHHYGGPPPDIVHAHDWQSAPVVFGDVHPSRSIFTIHNMEFGVDQIGRAVAASSVSTTVSPTYATEISGHPAIAPNLDKFFGIRNGIDQEIWDPLFDKALPRAYSHENIAEGKEAAKAELRRRMELSSADVPLVSVVTRLTHQKGIHLIKHAAWRTLERGGQFVLLGSAPDPRVQGEFNALAGEISKQYPDRGRFWFAYDEPLSHLIYAGSDIFLVPSMFEPCGLTQMIAMRYGTVPVVRKTGGLNDTVFDIDDDMERAHAIGMDPNGFSFVGADAAGLDYALNRALELWYTNKERWAAVTKSIMQQDWSWTEPAFDYIEIYHKALKN